MRRKNFMSHNIRKLLYLLMAFIVIDLIIAMGGIELAPNPEGKVTPENGALYIFGKSGPKPLDDREDYIYTYIINMQEMNKNVMLQIYNPSTDEWLNAEAKSTKDNSSELTYSVNFAELLMQPFLEKSKFRVSSNGTILGVWDGPDINVNFRNETATKRGEAYDYSVEVRASKDIMSARLPVYIYYKNNKNDTNYTEYESPQYYSSTEEAWETLVWKDAPYFWRLEFVIDKSLLKKS